MRCHVLDQRRHPVPVGVSGELYVGGIGLAEGYVNRPGLTAEHFVADPFHPKQRLYRTGERARYSEEGTLELLGRLEQQGARPESRLDKRHESAKRHDSALDQLLDRPSLPHPRRIPAAAGLRTPPLTRELPDRLPGSGMVAPGASRRAPHLLALQEGGTRPPLVFLGGAGGEDFRCRDLTRFLGADQPVYAFSMDGTDVSEALKDGGIEGLATVFEKELAALHGDRPFVFAGFGFGALVAFELACRRQTCGRRVPLLISADGFAPGFAPGVAHSHSRNDSADPSTAPDASQQPAVKTKRPLAARLVEHVARLQVPRSQIPRAHAPRPDDARARAAQGYLPRTSFQGTLLLLRAEEPEHWRDSDFADPFYGWERVVTGTLTVSTLPATHTELLIHPAHQKASAAIIARHIDAVVAAERKGARASEAAPSLGLPAFSAWASVNSVREV